MFLQAKSQLICKFSFAEKMFPTTVHPARRKTWASWHSTCKLTWPVCSTGTSKSCSCIWQLNTRPETMNWIKSFCGTKFCYVAKMPCSISKAWTPNTTSGMMAMAWSEFIFTLLHNWPKTSRFWFHFRGHKNVTLTLSWNIVPNAGLLPNIFGIGEHSFKFPDTYQMSPV